MKIELPWPAPELSPNARKHWRPLAALKKGAREYAYWVTHNAMPDDFWDAFTFSGPLRPVNVTITFHPPDNRRRDLDNAIAAFKASQDGIADALGIDDSKWNVTYRRGEPIKDGKVLVEILP